MLVSLSVLWELFSTYISRGRHINCQLWYLLGGGGGQPPCEFLAGRQFFALVCVAEKRYGGHKFAGTLAKFALVWAGLNAKCPALSAKFLTPGARGVSGTYFQIRNLTEVRVRA